MYIYEFWASVISSITSMLASFGWPAAVFGCLYLFRKEVRRLLPYLRLRHNETEFSFLLDEAEEKVDLIPAQPPSPKNPAQETKFDKLADISPRAAIFDIRNEIDAALRDAAKNLGITDEQLPLFKIVDLLQKRGALTEEQRMAVMEVRGISNTAIHSRNDDDVTKDEALRFRKLSEPLISFINAIGGILN